MIIYYTNYNFHTNHYHHHDYNYYGRITVDFIISVWENIII